MPDRASSRGAIAEGLRSLVDKLPSAPLTVGKVAVLLGLLVRNEREVML